MTLKEALTSFILLVTGLFASAAQNDPRPIFLTTEEIRQIKIKIQTQAWAKSEYQELLADANKLMGIDIEKEVPTRGGNWNFYYQSPKQHDLLTGRQVGDFQWEHIDEVTGDTVSSNANKIAEDLDGVLIGQIHNLWAKGMLTLSLAYRLTGEKKYANKAIEVLLKYSALYGKLPVRNTRGGDEARGVGHGKLFPQSLEESLWVVNAISAASLIWDKIGRKKQAYIRDSLFYPACNYILIGLPQGKVPNNIHCWEATAVGLTGLFFENETLTTYGLGDSRSGYTAQIEKGINADGLWVENAIGYHFYSLHPLVLMNRAANHCGVAHETAPLKAMFDAPLKIADHNLRIAGFNDSESIHLQAKAYLYEWGYAVFKDPRYNYVLAPSPRGKEPDHPGLFTKFALLFGADSISLATSLNREVTSFNLPNSGLAALTSGQDTERLWVNVKYDSNFTSHRHFDVGNFEIIKGSEYISKDLGRGNYASRHHSMWFTQSLSHNTYVVNERRQPNNTQSECINFGKDKNLPFITIQSKGKYDDDTVTVKRSIVLLDENTVFIADQFSSTGIDTIDISYHQFGEWEKKPGKALKRLKYTYARLLKPVSDTSKVEAFSSRLHTGRVAKVQYHHNAPTQWIMAGGVARTENYPAYLIMRRRTDSQPLFWCVTVNGSNVDFSEYEDDKGKYLVLRYGGRKKREFMLESKTFEVVPNASRMLLPIGVIRKMNAKSTGQRQTE